MKAFPTIVAIALVAGACGSNISSDPTGGDTASPAAGASPDSRSEAASGGKEPDEIAGCYLRVIGRDTLAARLAGENGRITGRLTFDNFEKDGSTGTVTGREENGILKLTYVFQSEGMTSVSEAYFQRTGRGIIHGTGDVAMRGDTAAYAAPSALNYPEENLLEKISCDDLPAKYR